MLTIFCHELKMQIKSFWIWFACVGGMGLVCILLFSSMEGSMEEMAESMASMGAFADAFGMSKLSIATLAGFFAAEVGTIHGLGGAMFAAIISVNMLSKEEDGHTSEFLFSLPICRSKVLTAKWGAITCILVAFNLLCGGLYWSGIVVLGEEMPLQEFLLFMVMQTLMHLEIGTICFALSAAMKKNKFGIGLGVVLMVYVCDMIARVVPDIKDVKVVSPFSYANAADILSAGSVELIPVLIGIGVMAVCIGLAYLVFTKRDLAT